MNPSSWNLSSLNPFRSSGSSENTGPGLQHTIWSNHRTSLESEMGKKDKKTLTPEKVEKNLLHHICLGKYTEKEYKEFLQCLKQFYLENPDPGTEINGTIMTTLISVLLDNDYGFKSNVDRSKEVIRFITKLLGISNSSIVEAWMEKRSVITEAREAIENHMKKLPSHRTKLYEEFRTLRKMTIELENQLDKKPVPTQLLKARVRPTPFEISDLEYTKMSTASMPWYTGSCKVCSKTETNGLKLKHLTCGHIYCDSCLGEVARKTLMNNSCKAMCPADGKPINREIILELLDEDEKMLYRKFVKWSNEDVPAKKPEIVKCPKCNIKILAESFFPGYPKFGECKGCDYTFCCKCFKDFHGGSMCDYADKNPSNVAITGKLEENQFGAFARQHEIDFYKPHTDPEQKKAEQNFTPEQIGAAFETPIPGQNEDCYPWELVDLDFETPNKYSGAYECLNDGNWVEDEILEKCMKILAKEISSSTPVCVLESYVMNWAAKNGYEDGNLVGLIKEKDILNQSIVGALMNTDLTGSGGHWMLGVIKMDKKTIVILDSSMVSSYSFYQKYFFYLLHILHVAYQLDDRELVTDEWKFVVSLESIQQKNANDCGPLAVANFYGIINFRQVKDAPSGSKVRKWIYNVLESSNSKSNDDHAPTITTSNIKETENCKEIAPFAPRKLTLIYGRILDIISNSKVQEDTGLLISLL